MKIRRFNDEAAKLSPDVVILTISMELFFAQKRCCGAAGLDRVIASTDHCQAEFGTAYGMLKKDLRLLERAVFVVDQSVIIRYIQRVEEVAKEPGCDPVMQVEIIRESLSKPPHRYQSVSI